MLFRIMNEWISFKVSYPKNVVPRSGASHVFHSSFYTVYQNIQRTTLHCVEDGFC